MNADEVRCREVVDLLTDYLEEALPGERRISLEEHLVLCEGCSGYLDQLRTTITLTGRLREEDVPAPVMERVLRMFEEE